MTGWEIKNLGWRHSICYEKFREDKKGSEQEEGDTQVKEKNLKVGGT